VRLEKKRAYRASMMKLKEKVNDKSDQKEVFFKYVKEVFY
jgi:hypothetical protein